MVRGKDFVVDMRRERTAGGRVRWGGGAKKREHSQSSRVIRGMGS